jgi:hypothetical protein
MGKTLGRRTWEAYEDHVPDGVKQRVDKVVRIGAHATRRVRDKKQIAAQGESLKRSIAKRFKF